MSEENRIPCREDIEVPIEYLVSFIREDAPFGDITSGAVIPAGTRCRAVIVTRDEGIISGISEASRLFEFFGSRATGHRKDGDPVQKGEVVISVEGDARSILLVERTALNIIGRMSGISTKTRRYMDLLASSGSRCRVAGTRKTSPGMRLLDKKAIRLGGGDPHRYTLSDGILIKDNHLVLTTLDNAIAAARARSSYRKIEVEVEDTDSAIHAARIGADIILLDNMDPAMVSRTIEALKSGGLRGERVIEVSGSITEENIQNYAIPGVDIISIGALTHSVRNFDVSLDIRKP